MTVSDRELGEIELRNGEMQRAGDEQDRLASDWAEHKATLAAMQIGEVIDYPFGIVRRITDRTYRVETLARDGIHWKFRIDTQPMLLSVLVSRYFDCASTRV